MSIIIIAFPAAPKVDPEALRKEDELNKLIKQKVTGMICYKVITSGKSLLELLATTLLPDWQPPLIFV